MRRKSSCRTRSSPGRNGSAARVKLLVQEKEFTRRRDELSRRRRELPWVRIDDYRFDGADGPVRLTDLFRGRSQLIVYHFMFDPDWNAGCKSCAFWADNYDRVVVHLRGRDTNLVAVSRAPIAKLESASGTRAGDAAGARRAKPAPAPWLR